MTANSAASASPREIPARAGGRSGSPVVWRTPPIASPIAPNPGSWARGPLCPQPDTCPRTSPGVATESAAGSRLGHRERGVVHAPPGQRAGLEVLDHDVDVCAEVASERAPGIGPQVDRDRLLVTRDRRPPEAATVDGDTPSAHRIAGDGGLHLDDLGAEVTEQLACERPGDERAELEDAQSCERQAGS